MVLSPLEGENGLLSGSMFEGTYQIGEDGRSTDYLYEIAEDTLILKNTKGDPVLTLEKEEE